MRNIVRTLACLLAGFAGPVRAETGLVLNASDARVTAPMALVDGVLHQSARTELPEGGTAVFTVQVPVDGDYTLQAVVDAPGGDANSFYLNFDTAATGDAMIWDIPYPYTDGFEERTVTWRGRGHRDQAEFEPQVFALTAGEHRLIVTGREPARLKSMALQRYHRPAPGTLDSIQQAYEETDKRSRLERIQVSESGNMQPEVEQALRQKTRDAHAGQFAEALRMAEAHAGQPRGLEALSWVLHTNTSHYQEAGPQAVALTTHHFAADPRVAPIVAYLSHYLPYPGQLMDLGTRTLFETVARDNPDRTARGQARLGLALLAKRDFDMLDPRAGEAADEKARIAIALLEKVSRDYGDCPYLKGGPDPLTLAQKTGRELVELRALRVGMPAPDIVGQDLDGRSLKLSDYRGKVVMLVFWASWCGPCMQAVPHEKELVGRYKDRPFVLIGVNGDDALKNAQNAVTRNEIPWRSFWDGADARISNAWNVLGWPTVYLIDHEGLIHQSRFFQEEGLEPLVVAAERKP